MLIGIDYGIRNIGVAISDDQEKIALSYKTFGYKDLVENISNIVREKNITKIIIGLPMKGNGEEGYVAKMMKTFLTNLQENFPQIEIIQIDESMSTQIAINRLKELGYNYKSIENLKDQESARVILQSFIDQNQHS